MTSPLPESAALYWARRYHADADDARQEYWLWLHEGAHSKLELRSRIAAQGIGILMYRGSIYRRRLMPIVDNWDAADESQTPDNTDICDRAVAYWVRNGILSRAAAEGIYRHYVEGWTAKDIAALYDMTKRQVDGHIFRGIAKLRAVYERKGAEMYGQAKADVV